MKRVASGQQKTQLRLGWPLEHEYRFGECRRQEADGDPLGDQPVADRHRIAAHVLGHDVQRRAAARCGHSSHTAASNAGVATCVARSVSVIANTRRCQETRLDRLPCSTITPFGAPVDPDV